MARLKRDDKVIVTWVDILEDTGDPKEADLHVWKTIGYFVRVDIKKDLPVLVIRPSIAENEKKGNPDRQSGWICFPAANVKRIQRLKLTGDVTLSSLEANETPPRS